MKEIRIFEAFDGKEFSTREECLRYERENIKTIDYLQSLTSEHQDVVAWFMRDVYIRERIIILEDTPYGTDMELVKKFNEMSDNEKQGWASTEALQYACKLMNRNAEQVFEHEFDWDAVFSTELIDVLRKDGTWNG